MQSGTRSLLKVISNIDAEEQEEDSEMHTYTLEASLKKWQ